MYRPSQILLNLLDLVCLHNGNLSKQEINLVYLLLFPPLCKNKCKKFLHLLCWVSDFFYVDFNVAPLFPGAMGVSAETFYCSFALVFKHKMAD